MRRLLALFALMSCLVLVTAGLGSTTALAGSVGPCGSSGSAPSSYDHVIVVMEENTTYNLLQASTADAPYTLGLEQQCGSYSNMHGVTHPSNPNYMALTSGISGSSTTKRADDNIFHQLQAASKSWKVYEESMPANCSPTVTSAALYKAGHNPAFWYTDLFKPVNTCATNDVPFESNFANDLANGTLPNYSFVAPNLCHQFYWKKGACTTPKADRIKQGDAWLSNVIPQITSTPSYVAGNTLIIITWDEGTESGLTVTNYVDCTDPSYYSGHPDCHVPTIVLSPYIAPGAVDGQDANLFSILGTTEDMFGLPRLGYAATGGPNANPADIRNLRSGLGF